MVSSPAENKTLQGPSVAAGVAEAAEATEATEEAETSEETGATEALAFTRNPRNASSWTRNNLDLTNLAA